MKSRSFAAFFALAIFVRGSDAQELAIPPAAYPTLAATALDSDVFAPPGWKLQAKAAGDLDKDGDEDVVFVLHEDNPANIIRNEGLGVSELNTNPRMLGVGFREGHGYRLVLQNTIVIPRHTEPVLEDPFDAEGGLAVARGAFSVKLISFANAGGWEAGDATLTFRWQNGRFELIGWDRSTVRRNTGETEDKSANFSTGILEVSAGSIEHDRKKTTKKKIALKPLPIDQVGDGLLFGTGAEGSPAVD